MQFGLSYISALLKKHGHQTQVVVLSRLLKEDNNKRVDEYIQAFAPQMIGFTSVFSEYNLIRSMAAYIKQHYPNIFLVIGGCHASLNPGEVIEDGFDAVCIGEGEYPLLELADQLEKNMRPAGIPNCWFARENGIEKNPPRAFIEDLSSLPFPDRAMWQQWIQEEPDEIIPIMLGRGCVFNCSYCCNHALRTIAPGQYVRLRSTDNVIAEVQEIIQLFPKKKYIYFEVESFGIDKRWAYELCEKLKNLNQSLRQPLSFGVNLRVTRNPDFEALFAACKSSNFTFLNIGLESGSERVRRDILKRDYSNEDLLTTVRLAKKYGLKVMLYNLVGIPGETIADFKETVSLNRACAPDGYFISIFFPYPGTKLYDECKHDGLIHEPLDTEWERRRPVLDLPGFPKEKILEFHDHFGELIYQGVRPSYARAFLNLASGIYARNYFLRRAYRVLKGMVKRSPDGR